MNVGAARFWRRMSTWNVKWPPSQDFRYPTVQRSDQVNVYTSKKHGRQEVPDPYIALEDPESSTTRDFVERQNETSRSFFEQIAKERLQLRDAIEKSMDYARPGLPSLKGDGRYYTSYNSGLLNQNIILSQDPKELGVVPLEQGHVWLDPNKLAKDGTVSLGTSSFSEHGKYFAYGLCRSGSDWTTIYVRPVKAAESKTDKEDLGRHEERLEDTLEYCKFTSIAWTKDESGFFYQRFPAPKPGQDQGKETTKNEYAQLRYHVVGQSQTEDVLVYHDPKEPEWQFAGEVTDDGQWLILYISKSTAHKNKVYVTSLHDQKMGAELQWQKLVDNFDGGFDYVANDGSIFYFSTNLNAPRTKVVTCNVDKPEEGFVDHIPEHPQALLSTLAAVNEDYLVLIYSQNVNDEIHLADLKTGSILKRLAQDEIGSVTGLSARRKNKEFFFSFSGFSAPGIQYRYRFDHPDGQELSTFKVIKAPGIEPEQYTTRQIFYPSKDGTKIPMFITHRKDLKLDGKAPALLYGYGGFNISINPFFSPSMMVYVKHYNGVLAVANLRGGGEMGEAWHEGGMLDKKQNVFDDFQEAGKWLVANKYTSHDRIAVTGGSNGGLLVTACLNQTPELFAAGMADVGVHDMLKFHKASRAEDMRKRLTLQYTIGWAWTADYGNPDDPEAFDYIRPYSPLHNVRPGVRYPGILLLSGDHDDRVVPLHTMKMIAQLQHDLADNENPLLATIDTGSGHGAGKPTSKRIDEASYRYIFAAAMSKAEWHDSYE